MSTTTPTAKRPPDITRADADELRRLHAEQKVLLKRTADDVAAMRRNAKAIDAIADKAKARMIADAKAERTRHGIRFAIASKPGRVAWRKIVEKLKGKAYADKEAAAVAPVQSITYTL